MQLSTLLSIAMALTSATAFQLSPTHEDAAALQEACDTVSSATFENRKVKRACEYGGCDPCYEEYAACRWCSDGDGSGPSCLHCLAYCQSNCC